MSTLSMLEYLEMERVVAMKPTADNKYVQISEQSEQWFSKRLDKAEFKQLIDELSAIYMTLRD